MERDRFKDAKLLAANIRPMRVTDRRFEDDLEGVLADLRDVLRPEACRLSPGRAYCVDA